MKERPILFSGAMVRAILDGKKTQTRRVVKPQPHKTPITNGSATGNYDVWPNDDSCLEWDDVVADTAYYVKAGHCPYGQIGDRLWVRETWLEDDHIIRYRADGTNADQRPWASPMKRWNPSIFMPRWASRITLDVVNVRVERVQEMKLADVAREGILKLPGERTYDAACDRFVSLWNEINAKRGFGWDVNPWVWVVEFSPS